MRVNIALLTVTDTRTLKTDKSGNILVKKKDPEEFYKILKFHKSKENDFKYQ